MKNMLSCIACVTSCAFVQGLLGCQAMTCLATGVIHLRERLDSV